MATLPPDQPVVLQAGVAPNLRFPPPAGAALCVAVHPAALNVGGQNRLTLVTGRVADRVAWVGALDESLLCTAPGAGLPGARTLLGRQLLRGGHLWEVIRPGLLTTAAARRPYLTIYDGDRPWVVVGELAGGDLLAAPLNDARGNPKWWAPQVAAEDLALPGAKPSQIELAHLWSFRDSPPAAGKVLPRAHAPLARAVTGYFR